MTEETGLERLYDIYLRHPRVTTDSRFCPAGGMFFALRGESFDGNQYALAALDAGCAVAVVDDPAAARDGRFVLVSDALAALQGLAALHRRRWGGTVVQITGTNGKTTTKELVTAVLSRAHSVQCTGGNHNNHIGVPLTLLSIGAEHDMAVVETGANHPGEIAFLCGMARADCGLVTNVGRAHLAGFGSLEGVERAKGELYDDLRARGGFLFLNTLDPALLRMARARGFEPGRGAVPYVEARVDSCDPCLRVGWRDTSRREWRSVATRLIGAYNLDNARAAITVGLRFGVSPEQIDEALAAYTPTNSRSELRLTGANRLVVDAYNANPSSMAAALDSFARMASPRKMVILGDMRELGSESRAEHQRVADRLRAMPLEAVWLVGAEFAACDTGGISGLRLFATADDAARELESRPLSGLTILVKGSNGTRLHLLPKYL